MMASQFHLVCVNLIENDILFIFKIKSLKFNIFFIPLRIPTIEDEYRKENEVYRAIIQEQEIRAIREQIFQECMKTMGSGYYTYQDYVNCKPHVDREMKKFLESRTTESTVPGSDEIVKVESGQDEYEYEESDEDTAEFLGPEHHKLQVGFWARLWHKFLDGEPLRWW